MVPGITGSRGKWLAKTQAIEDNCFLAMAYPWPNLPFSMLMSMILSNASSGGLGSFGVFSPNKVPSLQRINSEEAFACLHLVIVAPHRLELFDADLLIGNVPFQFADVLLGLDKLEIFRIVLHFSSPSDRD
jgi:hypothetical protein